MLAGRSRRSQNRYEWQMSIPIFTQMSRYLAWVSCFPGRSNKAVIVRLYNEIRMKYQILLWYLCTVHSVLAVSFLHASAVVACNYFQLILMYLNLWLMKYVFWKWAICTLLWMWELIEMPHTLRRDPCSLLSWGRLYLNLKVYMFAWVR